MNTELDLRRRWEESRHELNLLRLERIRLVACGGTAHPHALPQRLRLTPPSSVRELNRHYRDMSSTHRQLCASINETLGARTVQRWQRERRKSKPRPKHLAHVPPPTQEAARIITTSPDPRYGQSGCGSC